MGRCEFCGRAASGLGWRDGTLPLVFRIYYHFCGREHLNEWLEWKDREMRPDPRENNARNAAIEAVLLMMNEWAEKHPNRSLKDLDRGAANALCKVAIQNYSDCLIKSARGPHGRTREK